MSSRPLLNSYKTSQCELTVLILHCITPGHNKFIGFVLRNHCKLTFIVALLLILSKLYKLVALHYFIIVCIANNLIYDLKV